ncbi:SDR family NAD(P)-dependent oxidoreductase [Cupriavidus sp. 30B13]|uniref:SDR family NAD(P)-dependent oxidoreductase n=1 Tax=Cupriavidus sp. 30B13 TaxID=3384241 RepID=UPI003B8FDF9F
MQELDGKVFVVTGAATGIGFALAKQLGAHGTRLVLAGRRRDRLEEAEEKLRISGVDARSFACDVTDRGQVDALADFSWKAFGHVDAIVNNAGIGPVLSTVIEARREDVQHILDVNLFGAWNGTAVFGQRFIAQRRPAAIYNVGSENCFFNAVPGGAGYVASKHALLAMTIALREEVPEHIEVALICPGLVQSELGEITREGMDTDQFAASAIAQIRAGEFFVVTHAYNIVRIQARNAEVDAAYARYAPRYPGDDAFDVRTLGDKLNWWAGAS